MYRSNIIQIGNRKLGGGLPLLIQSMTNTNTNDIEATVGQCRRIFDRGADMVRITTQSLREVESLRVIRDRLRGDGYLQPLVADVHFQPKVAEEAAKIVEKVRINPGNYIPPKYNGPRKFDAVERDRQLNMIHERLLPLISVCRAHGSVLRIGVNHGSLSERILNWYGNTPEGMVASALEFLELFRAENFDRIVLSLKASSVRLMVQANRLMVRRMAEQGMAYPLHLGVTEAGDEEEGRIKSSTGICSLLADGIGDTLRVSLTEDPEEEIPVAMSIASIGRELATDTWDILKKDCFYSPFSYAPRRSTRVRNIGGDAAPVVISSVSGEISDAGFPEAMDYSHNKEEGYVAGPLASDFLFMKKGRLDGRVTNRLPLVAEVAEWKKIPEAIRDAVFPLIHSEDISGYPYHPELNFLKLRLEQLPDILLRIKKFKDLVLVFELENGCIRKAREGFRILGEENLEFPVVLYKKYSSGDREEFMIRSAAEFGSLFIDGFGDGIWLEEENSAIPPAEARETGFNILQASSARISKTEYIACPSCGRTLFNIQASLKTVKEATAGMRGLKIAVMGCIVNGPGEMADADFGYVGAGPGRITLYKGRKAVMKNLPEEEAVNALLKLIEQESGK